ncbi:hypothetical protein [uncultured Cohaesibacter sp.]|uniref:hypothetical protein n=1 Tax=uncultured Cohaesibacter sp. TaxID=1002546 RepID=UPI0029C6D2D1|nr:hypothetical protein [uncultured Cohaesibacter sp.]
MKIRPVLACLLALVLLAAGCSYMSVRHLKRVPFTVDGEQTLTMKFWRFSYRSMPLTAKYGVVGVAFPVAKALPEWATTIDELWLAAYLCDEHGRVIARDKSLIIRLSRLLDPRQGVPFEFILEPEDLPGPGPLFVTFGYRVVVSDGTGVPGGPAPTDAAPPKDAPAKPRVFFAKEGALTLF